jgi:TonB family protein
MAPKAVSFHCRCSSALCGIAVTLAVCLRGHAQSVNEYQVKAAYLYNFAKGTEWPAQVLPASSTLAVCVFGGDADFVHVLRSAFSGKSVNEHPLQVRQVDSGAGLKLCHVAFFRASAPGTGAVLGQLRHGNVLLVGEEPGFLLKGGMINFVPRGGRISFEVSPEPEHSLLHYGVTPPVTAQSTIDNGGSRPVKNRVEPVYPEVARNINLRGTVLLQVKVRPDGIVKTVNVVGGHPMLAAAAVDAVMKWRFQAAARETNETVRITFGQ